MTTRNSTAAQLRGKQIKRQAIKAVWIMNTLSAILIITFYMITR